MNRMMTRISSGFVPSDCYTVFMTRVRASSPRYRRPEEMAGIALTDDDRSILWHVFRHRLIDSASLYALHPHRSRQVLSRRLRRLWETEFLDRPIQQSRRAMLREGSDPLVYALAREGARFLRDEYSLDLSPDRWSQKNRELKPLSIQHHLATTRFMVRAAVDTTAIAGARFLYGDEVIQPTAKVAGSPRGLSTTLRAVVPWYGITSEQGTAPDAVFAIDVNGDRQIIFLEMDQGTETVEPNARKIRTPQFWRDTSILRKMAIYAAAFRSKAHEHQFGIKAFRVLFVTRGAGRIGVMQDAYRKHLTEPALQAPPGLFLFAEADAVGRDGNFLSLPLMNAGGREITFRRST